MKIKRSRPGAAARRRSAVWGYIFILPFIIGFIFMFLIPLGQSVQFSFSTLKVSAEGYTLADAGWSHYRNLLLVNVDFRKDLLSSFASLLTTVPVVVIFSFFAANLINRKFIGRAFVRSVFFIPVILASGVIMKLEASDILLSGMNELGAAGSAVVTETAAQYADLTKILSSLGMGEPIIRFITATADGIYDIIISSGVQIIIFLSGLQSISPSIYEAAQMEGATGWETFWKITFPMVSPLILVNTIYSIVDCFVSSQNVVMQDIQKAMVVAVDYGQASAMAWLYFIPIMGIMLIAAAVISKKVFYYD